MDVGHQSLQVPRVSAGPDGSASFSSPVVVDATSLTRSDSLLENASRPQEFGFTEVTVVPHAEDHAALAEGPPGPLPPDSARVSGGLTIPIFTDLEHNKPINYTTGKNNYKGERKHFLLLVLRIISPLKCFRYCSISTK